MRPILLLVLCCCLVLPVSGQEAKNKVITDRYAGTISTGKQKTASVSLSLTHEPLADEGSFSFRKTAGGIATDMTGSWTVLRGDAKNENATVVELYTKDMSAYFLRRRDGRLQQLDSTLHEIAPVSSNLLTKVK